MKLVRAAVAAAALLAPAIGSAAVKFENWRATSFTQAVDDAATARRKVVLIVTQPDWCPPCIKIDKLWLKNAADSRVGAMTAGAMVLEVRGYDEPEAGILRAHGVAFRGTPTTHVFAPTRSGARLGDAKLIGSIVGGPDDYPDQLEKILNGEDPLRDLERRVDGEDDRVARAKLLLELGDAYASRGDGTGARACYSRVRHASRSGMTVTQQAQLDELRRGAAWRMADTVNLRVRKAWGDGLADVRAYEHSFPRRLDERGRAAYAKAWALVHLGRTDEALRTLKAGLREDADGAETFLYFCFRADEQLAWTWGERHAAEALMLYPERRAALLEGAARIARRQGRLADAERQFAEAVSLEKDPETRLVYEGELENVRAEIVAAAAAPKEVIADARDGGSDDGSRARAPRGGLGR